MHEKTEILVVFGLVLLLLMFMFTLVVSLLLFYSRRRHADQIYIREMEDKYEQELLKTQLEVQEQTLEDLSREIHDNIGSLVSIANAMLQSDIPINDRLNYVSEILRNLQAHLRDLSKSLSIETIRTNGLTAAVEQLVNHLKKIGHYEVNYAVHGNYILLEEKIEIIIFRILQESVNNILKHAQATNINIIMTNHPMAMCFAIEDNGRGIDLTVPPKAGGITNIKRRAELIAADLKIENPPAGGTKITLCIPLTKTDK